MCWGKTRSMLTRAPRSNSAQTVGNAPSLWDGCSINTDMMMVAGLYFTTGEDVNTQVASPALWVSDSLTGLSSFVKHHLVDLDSHLPRHRQLAHGKSMPQENRERNAHIFCPQLGNEPPGPSFWRQGSHL